MSFLSLQRLSKTFPGPVSALRDLTLAVERDECLALLGPSGCGKTTTLRLIAGLDAPTSGDIFFDGRNVTDVPPWQRGTAFAFQRPALLPNQTVRRHLRSVPVGAGTQSDTVIEVLSLQPLMDRHASALSGGERQRVALARTLLSGAPLLLMDEPLAHLDVPVKRNLWQELALLRRRFPVSIVYVTHDPAEALGVADRIAVLLDGIIQQVDAPNRLRECPGHRFVAEVFQDPDDPLNFLDSGLEETRALGMEPATDAPLGKIAAIPASRLRLEAGDGVNPSAAWRVLINQHRFDGALVICERNRTRLAVSAGSNPNLQPGQPVMVRCVGQAVHWFDGTSGRRVEAG